MKQTFSVTLFATLFVLGLTPGAQAGGCSDATYVGDYVFGGDGTTTAEGVTVPFAFLGRLTADGKGNFSGSGSSSLNGQIIHRTFDATYTVNSDCTGYYQGIDSTGAPFQGDIVFTGPSGRKYLGLRTLAGQTIYFTGEKD